MGCFIRFNFLGWPLSQSRDFICALMAFLKQKSLGINNIAKAFSFGWTC
jgi:hypothetical protein